MRRREAVAALLTACCWSERGRAQGRVGMPTVAYVTPNTRATGEPFAAAFSERLSELGWVEDRSVAIKYAWGDGRSESTVGLVEELVRLKPDVIVTHGVPNILAAKRATSTIPIVFALATDPVGSGFVESLSRPGGNLTGLSIQAPDLGAKRVQLLKDTVPSLRRLAVLGDPGSVLETEAALAAGRALGFEVVSGEVRSADDIGLAFAEFQGRADALYVCAVPLLNTNRTEINKLALAQRLPTTYGFREAVEAGAFMSYGPNIPDLFRRAASYVDRILRGTKPGDMPVEQPTKFEFVINLKTAAALGLTIPPALLARADEVIE